MTFLEMINPFKRIAELERKLDELERSTTGRFAVVMTSNKKIYGEHKNLKNRIEKVARQVKDFADKPKS